MAKWIYVLLLAEKKMKFNKIWATIWPIPWSLMWLLEWLVKLNIRFCDLCWVISSVIYVHFIRDIYKSIHISVCITYIRDLRYLHPYTLWYVYLCVFIFNLNCDYCNNGSTLTCLILDRYSNVIDVMWLEKCKLRPLFIPH